MNAELQFQITNFLHYEAVLQDSRRFEEWLELLTDDIMYRMPLRATTETREAANIVEDMTFFEETKISLTTRVKRLATASAWAESPAPRTRHFISNIFIEAGPNQDELKVRSNLLFKRSRASDLESEEIFGERVDVLRLVNEQWKIASRTIYPDQTILTVKNLSMFL
jgi:3-phenylpropionate/cinnamic acid dioxygenase small subunit